MPDNLTITTSATPLPTSLVIPQSASATPSTSPLPTVSSVIGDIQDLTGIRLASDVEENLQTPQPIQTGEVTASAGSSILSGTLLVGSAIAAIGLAVFGYKRLTADQVKTVENLRSTPVVWYVAAAILAIGAVAAIVFYAPPATAGLALMGLMA